MSAGWLPGARRRPSPNRDQRPAGAAVSLVVLHSISLPRGEYGGDAAERLFTNRLDPSEHSSFAELKSLRVSSHFLIRRDGELAQFVPIDERAWHAGVSRWRGRERCNDFSIGVELEGTDDTAFEEAQYLRLKELIQALQQKLPVREIAAHSDIAPRRKSDPGTEFDWARVLSALGR